MKLPELKKPDKYVGLYVVDFGDHSGVGFTAAEEINVTLHNCCSFLGSDLAGRERHPPLRTPL